jgi:RNA polymerase sigma-70 factor (ECF subfamily)
MIVSPFEAPAGVAPNTVDQGSLVAALKAGDNAAFEELMRTGLPPMLAVARRMLGREDDAQDAVQDAFLSALKAINDFDGRSQVTTWLHRIVINACLMKLRSQRRRPERAIGDLLPHFADDGHQKQPSRSWKPQPSAGIERTELRSLVRSKIDELPEPHREVLMLRDIEELDTDETATLLGLTPAAVKTRLHRARQALRTLLDPYFVEEAH